MRLKLNRKILVSVFILICAIVYFYLMFNVISKQDDFMPVKSGAILVLGHSLEEDGITPDPWLIERLELAVQAYSEGYGDYIIVSGGKGYFESIKSSDIISVALAMNNWLVERGIPAEKILLEERAANTCENFFYSKQIAEDYGIDSIIAVTNDFHIYRSMLIGKHYFSSISGYASPVPVSFNKFLAYAKEPLSIIKFYILDKFLN